MKLLLVSLLLCSLLCCVSDGMHACVSAGVCVHVGVFMCGGCADRQDFRFPPLHCDLPHCFWYHGVVSAHLNEMYSTLTAHPRSLAQELCKRFEISPLAPANDPCICRTQGCKLVATVLIKREYYRLSAGIANNTLPPTVFDGVAQLPAVPWTLPPS